jgi:EpsI family protein
MFMTQRSKLIPPLLIVALLCIAAIAAQWLRPQRSVVTATNLVDLQTQIPVAFGTWHSVNAAQPILPNPEIEKSLEKTYEQVLARTYVNGDGSSVMLTAAYVASQPNEMTQVHRPEICYRAQGFSVETLRDDELAMGHKTGLPIRRLLATRGTRNEPLSYWVTVGDKAVLPGIGRKLEQLRLGLTGWVADGMLIRVSSISEHQDQAFTIQDQFLQELAAQMQPDVRRRYFGN